MPATCEPLSLPSEIWSHVLSFLPTVELAVLQSVCFDWHRECRRIIFSRFEQYFSPINTAGHQMWCSAFKTCELVPLDIFMTTLRKFMGLGLPGVAEVLPSVLLRSLLTGRTSQDDLVSIQSFARSLEWFGPLEQNNASFLARICTLLATPGFLMVDDKQSAEEMLVNLSPGTYLVRFNHRAPGCYIISRVERGLVLRHHLIQHQPGGPYVLKNFEYSSLSGLIEDNRSLLHLEYPLQAHST